MTHTALESRTGWPRRGRLMVVLAALAIELLVARPACAADGDAIKAGKPTNEEQPTEPAEAPRHAFQLGEFRIKNFRPVEREKVTLDFTVWVEVTDENLSQFEQAWESREHRVRNQVITSARLVPSTAFEDPTLHTLRRRIYLRLRRAVPELPVEEVFISDFSYIVE